MKLSDMVNRRDWVCPRGCGEQKWMHELFGNPSNDDDLPCPPPPEPRDCCGRLPLPENDEVRRCSKGRCTAWWCVCGTFTGMSTGPVMCNCEYDRGEVPTTRDDAAVVADDDVTVMPADQFDELASSLDTPDDAPNLGDTQKS